jgi:hypothetical protein
MLIRRFEFLLRTLMIVVTDPFLTSRRKAL